MSESDFRRNGYFAPRSTLLVVAVFLLLGVASCETQDAGGSGDVLYADDFSDTTSGAWRLEGDEQGQAAIAGGQLFLTLTAPVTVQYVTLAEQTFSDFRLDVDVRQLSGSPQSSYGVLIRMAGPQQFYRFEVTGSGQFVVERHDGQESWVRLSDDWETSPALQEGLDVNNHLTIIAAGSTFSFYANEQLLTQVADDRYAAGTIALDAGSFGQTELEVAFDNLVVQAP